MRRGQLSTTKIKPTQARDLELSIPPVAVVMSTRCCRFVFIIICFSFPGVRGMAVLLPLSKKQLVRTNTDANQTQTNFREHLESRKRNQRLEIWAPGKTALVVSHGISFIRTRFSVKCACLSASVYSSSPPPQVMPRGVIFHTVCAAYCGKCVRCATTGCISKSLPALSRNLAQFFQP